VKGIKQANPLPPPQFPCFLLGGHTFQMTSPHMRRGRKTREDRGLVTYVWASGRRRRLHNAIRRFAVPTAHSRTTTSVWVTHTKRGGGWGAQRRAKTVGREGGHGLSRAEVDSRLVRVERGDQGGAGLPV
jgi:hypothetical protein